MQSKIHIYIYYNLENRKSIPLEYGNYEEEKIITSEVSIMTDEKIVKNILSHPKTKTNEYGEFIDYDDKYLKIIVLDDLLKFKEKGKMSYDWSYMVDSFYYIKCELVKNISNEIEHFLNNI